MNSTDQPRAGLCLDSSVYLNEAMHYLFIERFHYCRVPHPSPLLLEMTHHPLVLLDLQPSIKTPRNKTLLGLNSRQGAGPSRTIIENANQRII